MSKGGAGKVYFVLYLAVILELLIIFIERDEAEEHLRKQQREAIQIVQTILSQLQTGAGVSAITTRPKDNITLERDEPDASIRVYDVLVAVGDSASVRVDGSGKEIKGDDIPELQYKISHLNDSNIPEEELPLDTGDLSDPFFISKIGTDVNGYYDPTQIKGAAIPTGDPTAYFQLNEDITGQELAKGRRVKVFRVNFKPTNGAGWYRLRFESQTNQIMGVIGGSPEDTDTVRIGNVKLTVKQLRSVQKFLLKERGVDPNANVVLDYINKLLDPAEWPFLPGNRGANAIDVRVIQPDRPPPAEPVAEILVPRSEIYWYTGAPFEMPVKLGPKEGSKSVDPPSASLVEDPNIAGRYTLVIPEYSDATDQVITVTASNGGQSEESTKQLHVLKPELNGEWRRQRAARAYVGRVYSPETEWVATQIPPEHYHTIVKIDGNTVFDKTGTSFETADLDKKAMEVKQSTRQISTTVFWKPNGSTDRTKWRPLVSTDPTFSGDVQVSSAKIEPRYQTPTHDEGFEFTWTISQRSQKIDASPITIRQPLDQGAFGEATSVVAACDECGEYGLGQPRVTSIGNYQWSMFMEVVDVQKMLKRRREINGKVLQIPLTISARESQTVSVVQVTVRLGG